MKTNFFSTLALLLLTSCISTSENNTSSDSAEAARYNLWQQLSLPTGEGALPAKEITYYLDQETCVGKTHTSLSTGFMHAAPLWRSLGGISISEAPAESANLMIVCSQIPKEYGAHRRPYMLRAIEFNRDRTINRAVVEVAANWQIFDVNEDVLDWETYNPWAYSSMGVGYAAFGLMNGVVHKTAFWRGHKMYDIEMLQALKIQ